MIQDIKPILQFAGRMMLASLFAFLMHPILWFIVMNPPFDWEFIRVGFTYIIIYGLVGLIVRWKCWQYSWKRFALLSFFAINAVLAIALFIDLRWPRYLEIDGVKERVYIDAMTGLMILTTSAIAALLSAIPISLCCYWFRKAADPNDVDAEHKPHLC